MGQGHESYEKGIDEKNSIEIQDGIETQKSDEKKYENCDEEKGCQRYRQRCPVAVCSFYWQKGEDSHWDEKNRPFEKQKFASSALKKWADACKKARKELGLSGFVAIGGKTQTGKALHAKIKSLLN